MALAPDQSRLHLGVRLRRHHLLHQAHGALMQSSLGSPVRAPLDATVGGIGGGGRDSRPAQGGAVGPGAVAVPVGEEGGAVGHESVEHLDRRAGAVEPILRPPTTRDPLPLRVVTGIGGDDRAGRLEVGGVEEIAGQELGSTVVGVDVGIGESGGEEAAFQVDDVGPRQVAGHVPFVPDRRHLPVFDGHRPGPRPGGVGGEHLAVQEDDPIGHGGTV